MVRRGGKARKKGPRGGASPEATKGATEEVVTQAREHFRSIMQDSVRLALEMFLMFLTAPGGRWQTAENREEELIRSMKHIRDVVRDAPRANILTQEFVHELMDVRKSLLVMVKYDVVSTIPLNLLEFGFNSWALLENGSRRTAPPEQLRHEETAAEETAAAGEW